MKFWVAVTDPRWFTYLARISPDEVNFWQPSGRPPFVGARTGLPFLFKLRRPHNHVAGGAYFVTFSQLPLDLAWEAFGTKNGADSFSEFRDMLASHGRDPNGLIGCSILANPFFLEPGKWIANPSNWSPNIMTGRTYDTAVEGDAKLWNEVMAANAPSRATNEDHEKYGKPALVEPRLGQGAFRILVTEAYQRRCAMTGENTLVALEAAHIVPYAADGNHDPRNGLLLRADFHRLFDVGMVSVTPDLKIRISPRIREAYFNGKSYYRLDGAPLAVVPQAAHLRPDPDRLNWHLKNTFQA